jgi:DNA-binding transcriptional ArsR family regulator
MSNPAGPSTATRLWQLSAEASGMSGRLAGLAEEAAQAKTSSAPVTAADLRAILRRRASRARCFGPGLFTNPAWDMMLDLLAARLEGKDMPVSSLCAGSSAAPTTALRWIQRLEEHGLIARCPDPNDHRRVLVRLSEETAEKLQALLAEAQCD